MLARLCPRHLRRELPFNRRASRCGPWKKCDQFWWVQFKSKQNLDQSWIAQKSFRLSLRQNQHPWKDTVYLGLLVGMGTYETTARHKDRQRYDNLSWSWGVDSRPSWINLFRRTLSLGQTQPSRNCPVNIRASHTSLRSSCRERNVLKSVSRWPRSVRLLHGQFCGLQDWNEVVLHD